MNNIERFNGIIHYIEEHLTEEIDVLTLSRMAGMSVYEFRRIFAFVAGLPLGEYIRKRRLSAAAKDLMYKLDGDTISTIAARYGYDSPASFSRSFKAFHGVTPTDITKGAVVNMYTRVDFTFCVRGGKDIPYHILEDTAFYITGISGISDDNDTECCENVWNAFYSHETLQSLLTYPDGKIYAVYENHCGGEGVSCHIGERSDKPSVTYKTCCIPAGMWACFQLQGTEDSAVNAFYEDILFRWEESGMYRRNTEIPNLEVFPANMDSDNFLWEIRIPLL